MSNSSSFRVVRSCVYLFQSGMDSTEVVWTGSDPSQYCEGIGCYDEGDVIINRLFEKMVEGTWTRIDDPRV
jgi:hypothetical protein